MKNFGKGQVLEDVGRMDYILLFQILGCSDTHKLLLDGECQGVWNGREVSYFVFKSKYVK